MGVPIKSIGGNPIVPEQISGGAIEGLYSLLTAGAADGLVGGGPTVDTPFLRRVSGDGQASDGPATIKSIRGNTLRWNQHAPLFDDSSWVANSATCTLADSNRTVTVTSSTNTSAAKGMTRDVTVPDGHKWLIAAVVDASECPNAVSFGFYKPSGNVLRENVTAGSARSRYTLIGTVTSDATFFGVRLATATPSGSSATFSDVQAYDLTAMFGAGSEPSTIEEFEALYPLPYYEYDAGSLLSVQMEGIKTTGFNQWDEVWEAGDINPNTGANTSATNLIRSKNLIPVFPDTEYCISCTSQEMSWKIVAYDAEGKYIDYLKWGGTAANVLTFSTNGRSVQGTRYIRFASATNTYGGTYKGDICINLSDPARNGTYEPYWSQERSIPATDLRSAGTVYDELTESERITRVGVRAYQSGDESDATVTTDGTTTHYPLTTPTVTPIDPPINLSYRAEQGGTETILVPDGEMSAPVPMEVMYGSTSDSLRDRILAAIAPVENGLASANYAVGSYLVHGGTLCKVTTAIASGEAIAIGTNVTATTVMAEAIALTQ